MDGSNLSTIPEEFGGQRYDEFLITLMAKREVKKYLEIGVSRGDLLHQVVCEEAVGVDPSFDLRFDVTRNKDRTQLFRMTSDAFFSNTSHTDNFVGQVDFCFLDGMHTFEYLLRDFFNAEKLCHRKSLIAIHDCLPLNEEMADRDYWSAMERGESTSLPGFWTGDVWKVIPILKEYRADLKIVAVNAPPTGLLFVTNLNPDSTVLEERYLEIVEKYNNRPNTLDQIKKLYESLDIVETSSILKGYDHTLYFKI